MAQTHLPYFKKSFLAPKYWGLWIVLGLFRLILLLPYPILLKIGKGLSKIIYKFNFGKRRITIARRNLELCFPDYDASHIEKILTENIFSTGMAIIETGMAWYWPDWRIKKWMKAEGIEHLTNNISDGIILVGVHFLGLELGARMIGLHLPGIGVYRPNNNLLMDWLQTKGRLRSNKGMVDRKDLRGMLKAIRHGEMIWYAPDHDYGRENAIFSPFFAVSDAATTVGSYYLLKSSPNSKVIPFSPLRNKDGSGYTLTVSAPVDFSDVQTKVQIVAKMNGVVETEIKKGLEQYMWLHRRFKTRPEGQASLYD